MMMIVQHHELQECRQTTNYSTILDCAGIESHITNNEGYLTYLQSKKKDILNNPDPPPYVLLNYYYYLLEQNNLTKENKLIEYKFLLQQANHCKLKEPDCTTLYIILLEKVNKRKLELSEKISIYEQYLENLLIENEKCTIDYNYTHYKTILLNTDYKDRFVDKFKTCISL